MRIKTTKRILSRFITLSPLLKQRAHSTETLVEHCRFFSSTRDFQSLHNIARLIETPVGRLYEAIAQKNYNDPSLFIIENIPDKYRSREILCIAQALRHQGDSRAALKLLLESQKVSRKWIDIVTQYQCQKEIAIIQSIEGNHKGALQFLEGSFLLIRSISKHFPAHYYNYLNSLAVELGEVGRLDEAKAACSIALASPFAPAYPEWAETRDELEAKRTSATPSVVAFSQAPKAKPAPKPEPKENAAHVKTVAFNWLSVNQTSQRTVTSIAVNAAIGNDESTRTMLDRLGRSIHTRAPPTHP